MKNKIVEAHIENLKDLVSMALDLWPEDTVDELKEEFTELLESEDDEVFLYQVKGENIGFIHVAIRRDYVEGSDSSPVGYVEGIYVKPNYRKKGIARELVKKGEQWALSKGCCQMGSDIEYDNTISYDFHKKIGFKEANRIICFIKEIKE
ncbi:aminoglycoside 6'-N-acetyltransferase [Oceanirhabdus seepicola]|uniref:Aminoglycoside N(6')-acetyltransferase type 1 n=1 Tax=Oceanirhabdus seepicola TaxID=2828781 RepID=A0A9J6NUS5_9CLOT|nr:aminoglycoside 6'-N-acetyltransferase [Oceanirhabdus seepicola]MCM1988226.1 GNAT family N-acetyltransferase [Oceanirhabdus seepicola]